MDEGQKLNWGTNGTTAKAEDPGHAYLTVMCMNCGHTIRVPQFCGNRFCFVCSARRRSLTKNRLKYLLSTVKHPTGYRLKMVTLTIRSESNLVSMIANVRSAFKELRKCPVWKKNVSGGAMVVEVTGEQGNWHAHLHVLVSAKFIPYKLLLEAWSGCTNGSTGCFVQNMPLGAAVNECTKYVTKSQTALEDQKEVTHAMKGIRLFQPFGDWYAINNTYPKEEKPACPCCKARAWEIYEFSELAKASRDLAPGISSPGRSRHINDDPVDREEHDQYNEPELVESVSEYVFGQNPF